VSYFWPSAITIPFHRTTLHPKPPQTWPTMGKSAKLHKRVVRKTSFPRRQISAKLPRSYCIQTKKLKSSSSLSSSSNPTPIGPSSRTQVQSAKKRSTLKGKATKDKNSSNTGDGVLGGADYVSLLMGGRKKAKEEAQKLPKDDAI